MGDVAAVIRSLGSEEFTAEIFDSVSLAAKLAAAVTSRAKTMRIAYSLRQINRNVKRLLDKVDDIMAGKEQAKPAEDVTPQRIQSVVENLDYIARMMDYTYEGMKRARLTNNSLTASGLKTLKAQTEPLKDLADWLDALAKPEELQAIFNRAREERERGDLVDLAQVK